MTGRIFVVVLLSVTLPALGIDKPGLEKRIIELTAKFEALQRQPDKAISAENLRKAQAILLIDRTKAGFVFAYQGGGGVALAKGPKNGTWSPAAFLTASEASLGFQVGGEQTFYAILFMTTNATRLLIEPNITFGGEARGTAGDSTEGVEGKISPSAKQVLVYSDRQGLYGGVAIKGGAITGDDKANRIYYEQDLTMKDILFDRKVVATEAAARLAAKLTGATKASKGSNP